MNKRFSDNASVSLASTPTPIKLLLVDRKPELVEAWRHAFGDDPYVTPMEGDYFDYRATVMVSPANSFGHMGGGLDLAIRNELGSQIEERVKTAITSRYYGELPVGQTLLVTTGDARWKYLAVTPTMRSPSDIRGTLNVYDAFRGLLLCVARLNAKERRVDSLLCPGLGAGIGGMTPTNVATQMSLAYESICRGNTQVPTTTEISQRLRALAQCQ